MIEMKYYHLMMLLGGCILYMLLNIYPIIVYIIKTIRERDIKEIFRMPVEIILLLIPIIGSVYGLTIVDFEKKWYLIIEYIGVYLMLIGFIITVVVAFNA
jgi:hypothetical protein